MGADPFGRRPIYFDPESGATSSSALALSPAGLDPAVAVPVLAGALHPGRSLFLGLRRVPVPRHPGRASGTGSQADGSAADELLTALASALLGQAPPGPLDVALSGGLDSSVLTALLSRAARAGRAFTLLADFLLILVIDGAMILWVSDIAPDALTVDNYWWALLVAIVMSASSVVLEVILGRPLDVAGDGDDRVTLARLGEAHSCLLYTSPSPRDRTRSRMPSSA